MKKPLLRQILIVLAALLFSPAAYADLTAKMTLFSSTTAIKGNHLNSQDFKIRKAMLESEPSRLESTIYLSGSKIRCVTPTLVTISDFRSNTQTLLFPESKTKCVMPVLPAATLKQLSRNLVAKFVDMKETRTLLGLKVRLFKFYVKNSLMTSVGYIWSAPNILSPPPFGIGNSLNILYRSKLAGTASKSPIVTVIPRYRVKVSTIYEVSALSTAPIPASAFTIPSNYKLEKAPGVKFSTPARSY